MRIQYLGTAAAEGFPALFCRCDACRNALAAAGKNIRTRSSVLINNHLLIDLSPDILMQKLNLRLDLAAADALFITHSHSDHLDGAELTRRSTIHYCHIPDEKPLRVYGNDTAIRLIENAFFTEFKTETDPSLELHRICPGQAVRCGELTVTAVPAVHDPGEECLIYVIEEEGGQSLLYANDTALPPEETFAAIAGYLAGKQLDYVSMDCTHGPKPGSASHMGIAENRIFRDRLIACGACGSSARFIATHFGHNGGALHGELETLLGKHGIYPAWDGFIPE
ncbi:MBL fold metallo-hydrolase [Breznakiella homolactica]|uniref:MBL fold metallo-hydrolase n=1 Tax=Breznakiella homolactica TaxID=2798577 RepID=A0A7T8BBK0_9SPIR|nr:MBL fold metallo-hydrolase [Breznakiella homolactica]QQO09303.1 MBL fold metallo-hydrolase [Breznakiella homolactica]